MGELISNDEILENPGSQQGEMVENILYVIFMNILYSPLEGVGNGTPR